MDLWVLFSLINGVTAILFGLFIYLKDREKILNKTFLLMNIGVAIWSFSYCKWLLMVDEEGALFWSRMLNFGATLIPIFYLHLALSFLNLDKKKRKILIFGYLLTFIFLSFSFTSYYIKSVEPILFFPYWPQAGPLYICFLFFGYLGLVGYGLYQLFKIRKTALGEKRNQIDYIVLATIVGFGGGATNFPLMFKISLFSPFGQPLVALYPFIITLAILRYHLFEIRVILTEILVGMMGVVLLVLPFSMPVASLKILTIGIFLFFCLFGYLLIRATHQEVKRRDEIEKLYEELKVLDKAKSEFVAITSHQLRTPLTAIKGYISMILEGTYGKLDEKVKLPMEKVYKSNERLIKLINDLLNVSRIESGRIEMKLEKLSVEEIIAGVMEELKNAAKEKNLYLKFEKPKTPLPKILADEDKIRQVILNVVDNAIRYTERGGVEIKLEIENPAPAKIRYGAGLKLKIIVSDTGVGMTRYELSKIFESFSRATAGTQFYTEGVGLGLYIARKFVEMHNGKIWAESKGKGKGSTFYIELPIK